MLPSRLPRQGASALAIALLLAAGCSPVFNWRETPIEGADLVALLPCKPDRAQRELRLGEQAVAVRMVGCETGGATFAVAQAGAADAAQAQAWMAAWQAQARAQWAGARIEEAPAVVLRAAAAPAPARLVATRAGSDAGPGPVQLLWFTHVQRDGRVALYQATVLGKPSARDAVDTFFEGLRLP